MRALLASSLVRFRAARESPTTLDAPKLLARPAVRPLGLSVRRRSDRGNFNSTSSRIVLLLVLEPKRSDQGRGRERRRGRTPAPVLSQRVPLLGGVRRSQACLPRLSVLRRRQGWVASWIASFHFFACIGTMSRWLFHAGRTAPINRTHSRRFALAAESADHASAFGVRAP